MQYIAQSLVTIADRGVRLKWKRNTEPDLLGYLVYMSIGTPDNFEKVTPAPIPDPEFVSPILRPDTKYYFKVSSIDEAGNESAASDVIEYQLPD